MCALPLSVLRRRQMADGQFRCLGSPQYLKAKYGKGIELACKARAVDRVAELKDAVQQDFPGATVTEEHLSLVVFEVPSSFSWSATFSKIEKLRSALDLEDYSVSQSSLERVFIDFAGEVAQDV